VEGVDEVLGVAEVLGGFPGPTRDRPILPMDKILELAIVTSGVEDGFDFKFVTVNNGWCRGVLHAAGDVVGAKRLEQGDVKHGVQLHGGWELESIRCWEAVNAGDVAEGRLRGCTWAGGVLVVGLWVERCR